MIYDYGEAITRQIAHAERTNIVSTALKLIFHML